jgi:hypothetical protein
MDREYPGSETACCELRVEEKEVERRVRVSGRIILASFVPLREWTRGYGYFY